MMWFGLYSRNNNKMDSSGFEHIFAGLDPWRSPALLVLFRSTVLIVTFRR